MLSIFLLYASLETVLGDQKYLSEAIELILFTCACWQTTPAHLSTETCPSLAPLQVSYSFLEMQWPEHDLQG